jgi:Flp pilus assembly protein TadD
MKRISLGICLIGVMALAGTAQAQTSNALGKIVDPEGNPVVGVKLVFSPQSNPSLNYPGKTNKKGRYAISGMFTGKENEEWSVTLEAPEGSDHVATNMKVESRSVNRVLLGDIFEKKLRPGAKITGLRIAPLGTITIDFVFGPVVEDPVVAEAKAKAKAQAKKQRDPWAVALTHAQDGNLEESLGFFDKAISRKPDDPERYGAYAKVLYQLNRYDEAAAQAHKAIELEPTTIDSRMVLYSINIAANDMDTAKQTLLDAQEVAPGSPKILRQLAFVASETGDTEAEVAAYEALVEANPGDTEAWLSLGDRYARSGDTEKSKLAYEKVSELDPQNAYQIFFNLGALMMNKAGRSDDETQQAIAAFQKAVELKPDYAQAHKELGFALLNVGDKPGAADSLAAYVDLAPEAADAAQMKAILTTLQK